MDGKNVPTDLREDFVTLRLLAAGAALVLMVSGCSDAAVPGSPGVADSGTPSGTVPTSDDGAASETVTTAQDTTTANAPSMTGTAPAPTETAVDEPELEARYVYYVVDTRVGLRLARELRDIPAGAADDAVRLMIAGALDPDYGTTWNPETEVNGIEVDAGMITVDLSDAARTANVGSEGAAIMIQQLVWTVTDAVDRPDASVRLLLDGAEPGDLWGVVTWAEPVTREAAESIRALVQLDIPRQGDELTSPVTIAGDAAAFEATVPWRILDAVGTEVDSGFTMTSEGMIFAPFSFTVDLAPGDYTVEIIEDDPSDGEAGAPSVDTRYFTVVP